MLLRPSPLPQDPGQLSRLVLALDAENADLKARVAFLERQLFGPRSEKLASIDPDQIALDFDDLSAVPSPANDDEPCERLSHRRRSRPARNIGALPRHLPRYDEVITPSSTVCPCCSGQLHCIGEDVSEALDIVPALVRVKRTIRPRYACRACEGAIVQMPAPARFMDGGMATTALAAHVAVSKFAWHLPCYRQAQILAGHGIALDRGTLGSWVARVAWWLKPLYDRLLTFIRSQPRVFCDETPLPQLDPGRKRTKRCQLWAQAIDDRPWQGPAPPAVGYIFAESRSAHELAGQLASFGGVLQVDGYAAYKTLAKRRRKSNSAPVSLAFCLAHARRKFVDVIKLTGSPEALEVVARLAEVYRIEASIRGQSAQARQDLRQTGTAPIMTELKIRLRQLNEEVSAKSALGKAVAYTLAHWSGLTAFLDDGRIEVNSNIVERSIKPVCLTRKNALFVGNTRGGETFAILASLINTAKLNGLDPHTWPFGACKHAPAGYELADVLERVVSGRITINRLGDLLPWNWRADAAAIGQAA